MMDPHSRALLQTAEEMGLQVENLSDDWKTDALRIRKDDHVELVMEGRVYSHLSYQAAWLADDKHISKKILAECGLPTPTHTLIDLDDPASVQEQVGDWMQEEKAYVCKPLDGTDGHAVGMNKQDAVDVDMHIENYADRYALWLVEEQITGQDLRIQVIGEKLVAACIREPASITGDGENSLEDLIEAYNQEIAQLNPHNKLELDADSRRLMREQGLYLNSVPEAGQKVQLKYISNMGQGGRAVDVTDRIHPDYHEAVSKVAQAFGFRTFALDGITTDCSLPPAESFCALEVNAKAQWMHHTFSEGRTHDIPRMVILDLFPELNTAPQ